MRFRYALDDPEGGKGIFDGTCKRHDDERGIFARGDVHELFDDHGRAVVDVRGPGEIEDDDVMVLDVFADHPYQFLGRGHGETAPERDQADPGRELVYAGTFFFLRKELTVQQRNGHHAVQFEVLQFPGVGHAGDDQSDRHRGDQVDEHGQSQGDQQNEEMFPSQTVDPRQHPPVDDVPTHLHEYARQHGMGDRFDDPAQAQEQPQQNDRADHAGQAGRSACPDIGYRAHGGAGAGESAHQSGHHVADALPHQFLVRPVARTRQRIGDKGGEQAVHGTEQGEDERGFDGAKQEVGRGRHEDDLGQAGGYDPDDRYFGEPEHAQQRAGDQGDEGAGHDFRQSPWPEYADGQGDEGDRESAVVDVPDGFRQYANGADDATRRGRRADEGQGLNQHDDQADPGHEPRDHHVGSVGDVTADPQHAEQNLKESAQHDHDQGFAHRTGVFRYDDRHGHGHGRRGGIHTAG